MYLQLGLVKQHLNLEKDYNLEDEYLTQLVAAAEQSVRVHINDNLDGLARDNGGYLPAPIIQAMLIMVGSMYQNREVVGSKTVPLPFGYQYLIDLYRNYNK